MSKGLQQLRECVALLLAREPGVDRKLAGLLDPTRPLTAAELCERWNITSWTAGQKLDAMTKRAKRWGLRPLLNTRGWEALYNRQDVLSAEELAAGKMNRRRHAA